MQQANYGSSKNNRAALLVAFFGTVLILAAVLFFSGVYPAGEECFLRTDMYHQYAPFYSELQYKLKNGGSLLYSFDVGLGVNFTALYAYYLASPLNWLIVLWPENYVIEFMMLMVILKLGLAGVSMTWYLTDRFGRADFGASFFGIFYALSGYMAAYYWNIMWLDCILLFPLVVRGAERLVEEKKGILYAAALGLSILSNYYISIMTCFFLVLYFFVLNVLDSPGSVREFVRRGLRFTGFSLLAGALSAVLLLPEIAALSYTASYDVTFPRIFSQYFTVIDMLARHLVGVETEQGLDHWPNIYCGVAVLMLYLLYLSARGISRREKAAMSGLLLFFLASFSVNVLNFVWHGFHYPNSLPARQSYIYIFLVLWVSYRAYQSLQSFRIREIGRAFLIASAFIFLCQKLITAKHFDFWVYYLSFALLAAYAGLMILFRGGRLKRTLAATLAVSVVLIEAAANTALTSITTTSRTAYTEDNADVKALVDTLYPTTEFFRVEKVNRKTKNDGAWMHFPSVSLFSSMANADCTAFFKALGCEASTNAYSITGSTPFVNMLFSVKYALYGAPQTDGEEKRFLESRGDTYLYENRLSLPLGFVMPREMSSNWLQDLDNPALVQDALCDVLGTSAILEPNEELASESGQDYAVTVSRDGEYYAYVTNPQVKKVTVSIGDQKKTYENTDRGYLLELGQLSRGTLVSMTSETDGQSMEAQVYRFNYGALREVYNRLSGSPLKLTVWEDDYLAGTVTVKDQISVNDIPGSAEPQKLFLSIPYDKGWHVTVDGVPVQTEKAFNTFLAVPLETGTHRLELRFMPEGLREGAVISAAAFAVLLLLYLLQRRKRKAEQQEYLPDELFEEALPDEELPEEDPAEDASPKADFPEAGEISGAAEAEDESPSAGGNGTNEEKETDEELDQLLRDTFHLNKKEYDILERLNRMEDKQTGETGTTEHTVRKGEGNENEGAKGSAGI
ncbi:MAG: YfhO family protein [Eubacteriales bacterium]|nr:YfhO family protein [Eubacteriales bacterium]